MAIQLNIFFLYMHNIDEIPKLNDHDERYIVH